MDGYRPNNCLVVLGRTRVRDPENGVENALEQFTVSFTSVSDTMKRYVSLERMRRREFSPALSRNSHQISVLNV
ncbi:hypothetical protein BB347_11035 [Natronorubrum daqingense]|uniref:Uncharacterized protein n=1 Tax=Natronorubrum daqingense TaxID=588898 RepID=A0A1P8REL7_9EURY|nr:hypothetical protein BB347_11035 [Natronorubrum daqingense]